MKSFVLILTVLLLQVLNPVQISCECKSFQGITSVFIPGLELPEGTTKEKRIFQVAAAKTMLDMEANPQQVIISGIEVYSIPNLTGVKEYGQNEINKIREQILGYGFKISVSSNDPSFSWVSNETIQLLMYASSTRRETLIYFGLADRLPGDLSVPGTNPQHTVQVNEQVLPPGIEKNKQEPGKDSPLGKWGNLTGSMVNYIDEGNNSIVSGVSKGYGLELKSDGTFLQTTVINSGRPDYRIFISTTGRFTNTGNLLSFYPEDRHYRKWENQLLRDDEHTVPEPFTATFFRRINENTGKECIHIRYDYDFEDRELCEE